jgi:uncharacterized sulfatase
MKKTLSTLALSLVAAIATADTPETALLKKRTAEFRKDVIQVADNVYTATGYSVQPVSMIIGNDGLVIVDTGLDTISAQAVLAEFRKITDLPVKAIILTHGHGDHTGGLPVFAAEGSPDIWARDNLGDENHAFEHAGLAINTKRGARQGGFLLPPEKRINNGVAQAYYPKRGGEVFSKDESLKPTRLLSEERKTIEVAGIKLDLVPLNGETKDALYVWYPEKRVLFSGDNFYKSWPNLYAIRGSAYRDVQAWADSVDQMLQEKPDKLVPGHTRPITDKALVTEMLTNYRDAIRFVFDKTIEGMNKGLTPDELVDYVQLPSKYAEKDYLREYYGNVEWAVRSIFAGTLGWFDGNPTTLFSLPVKGEAERMAALAGGKDQLEAAASQALGKQDYQWAAQLSDHLIALDPKAAAPKLMKAEALEGLAENLLTATGRNYYLTCAQELRKEAGSDSKAKSPASSGDRNDANKKAALDFIQLILGDRDYAAARKYAGEYIQHGPTISDGYDALVEALETDPRWKDRPKRLLEFKNVAADGDLVYLQMHRKIKAMDDDSPARAIVVHVFRFNDEGTIDEHWSVNQSVKLKDSISKHPLF